MSWMRHHWIHLKNLQHITLGMHHFHSTWFFSPNSPLPLLPRDLPCRWLLTGHSMVSGCQHPQGQAGVALQPEQPGGARPANDTCKNMSRKALITAVIADRKCQINNLNKTHRLSVLWAGKCGYNAHRRAAMAEFEVLKVYLKQNNIQQLNIAV